MEWWQKIFFRIWRYFRHRASVCASSIYFSCISILCAVLLAVTPHPPFYWLKCITPFLCKLAFTLQTYVTTENAWNEWGSYGLLHTRVTSIIHTLIHTFPTSTTQFVITGDQLISEKKHIERTFPNVQIRWSVRNKQRHLGEHQCTVQ